MLWHLFTAALCWKDRLTSGHLQTLSQAAYISGGHHISQQGCQAGRLPIDTEAAPRYLNPPNASRHSQIDVRELHNSLGVPAMVSIHSMVFGGVWTFSVPEVQRSSESVRDDTAPVRAEAAAKVAQAGGASIPHTLLAHPQPCAWMPVSQQRPGLSG